MSSRKRGTHPILDQKQPATLALMEYLDKAKSDDILVVINANIKLFSHRDITLCNVLKSAKLEIERLRGIIATMEATP